RGRSPGRRRRLPGRPDGAPGRAARPAGRPAAPPAAPPALRVHDPDRPGRAGGPGRPPAGAGRGPAGGRVMAESLRDLVETRRILVCCGSGGVGKTTTAAALALEAARAGRRAVVVTIDPAKRLADALGLAGLTGTPSPIEG